MDTVSVYDAKSRLSELVDRAESGRSTTITKRGRVVARIVPARAPRAGGNEATFTAPPGDE